MYLKLILEDIKITEAWQKIIDELTMARLGKVSENDDSIDEIKWFNCSHKEMNQKSSDEEQKILGIIHDMEDWENMVEFWHSIRNNLFHGGKDNQDKRDRLLVKNGYKTLKPLMAILLKKL